MCGPNHLRCALNKTMSVGVGKEKGNLTGDVNGVHETVKGEAL
jgi:hypothetical protein